MKKIILIFLSVLLLTSCKLQSEVSPEILIERLTDYNENITIKTDAFYENDSCILFAQYKSVDITIKMEANDLGNVKKISLLCDKTKKTEIINEIIKTVIDVYAENEDSSVISSELFGADNEFSYYDTRWYAYSSAVFDDKIFFSAEDIRLSSRDIPELTLKENDIYEY